MKISVRNIVTIIELGYFINLNDFAKGENAEYEPEQFPAAIYKKAKAVKGTISFLVFGNGKINMGGCADMDTVQKEATFIEQLTLKYKKIDATITQ